MDRVDLGVVHLDLRLECSLHNECPATFVGTQESSPRPVEARFQPIQHGIRAHGPIVEHDVVILPCAFRAISTISAKGGGESA